MSSDTSFWLWVKWDYQKLHFSFPIINFIKWQCNALVLEEPYSGVSTMRSSPALNVGYTFISFRHANCRMWWNYLEMIAMPTNGDATNKEWADDKWSQESSNSSSKWESWLSTWISTNSKQRRLFITWKNELKSSRRWVHPVQTQVLSQPRQWLRGRKNRWSSYNCQKLIEECPVCESFLNLILLTLLKIHQWLQNLYYLLSLKNKKHRTFRLVPR